MLLPKVATGHIRLYLLYLTGTSHAIKKPTGTCGYRLPHQTEQTQTFSHDLRESFLLHTLVKTDKWEKGVPGRKNRTGCLRGLRRHDSFWGEMGVGAEQTSSRQITKCRWCKAEEFQVESGSNEEPLQAFEQKPDVISFAC